MFLKGSDVTKASQILILAFVIVAGIWTDQAKGLFDSINGWIVTDLNWFYVFTMALGLPFCLWLMLSRYGDVKLGKANEKAEFSFPVWIAMLFSAGLGAGLAVWGIAEPIYHFGGNPFMPETANGTKAAVDTAMEVTLFHWGAHIWIGYVVTGGALAYFTYNKGLPMTIRHTLSPILGKNVNGKLGKSADVLAILATIFGISTSMALITTQLSAGLYYLTGNEFFNDNAAKYALIVVIMASAIYSAVTGISRGIKILSNINMWLCGLAVVLVYILASEVALIGLLFRNLGNYIVDVIPMSFAINDVSWQAGWTVFLWAWAISWAPFIGVFVARISRGRTIKEFTFGVLIVPVILSFIWLTTFGNTALDIELANGAISAASKESLASVIYVTIDNLTQSGGMRMLLALLLTVIVFTFMLTSVDSGTYVLSTLAEDGETNPSNTSRVTWGVIIAVSGIALMYMGGLKAIQSAAIVMAFPYALIMWLMVYCLIKDMNGNKK